MADEVVVRLKVRDRAAFAASMKAASAAVKALGEAGDEASRDMRQLSRALDEAGDQATQLGKKASVAAVSVGWLQRAFGRLHSSERSHRRWGDKVVFQFNRIQFTMRELIFYTTILGPALVGTLGLVTGAAVGLGAAVSGVAIGFATLAGTLGLITLASAGMVGLGLVAIATAGTMKTAFGRDIRRTMRSFGQAVKEIAADLARPLWPIVKEQLPLILSYLDYIGKQIGPTIVQMFQSMSTAMRPLMDAFAPVIHTASHLVSNFVEFATPQLVRLGVRFAAILEPILPILNQIGRTAFEVFVAIADRVMVWMPAFANLANAFATTFAPIIRQLAGMTLGGLHGFGRWLLQVGRAAAPGMMQFLKGLGGALSDLGAVIQRLIGPLMAHGIPLLLDFADAFVVFVGHILDFAAKNGRMIRSVMQSVWDTINGGLSILLSILQAIGPIAPVFFSALLTVMQGLAPIVPALATALTDFFVALAPIAPEIAELAAIVIAGLSPVLVDIMEAFTALAVVVLPPLVAILRRIASNELGAVILGFTWLAFKLLPNGLLFRGLIGLTAYLRGPFTAAIRGIGFLIGAGGPWGVAITALVSFAIWKWDEMLGILSSMWSEFVNEITGGKGSNRYEKGARTGVRKDGTWIDRHGNVQTYTPGLMHGGPINSGSARWVGEEGPELFIPKVSGIVVPTGESREMVAAGGGASIGVVNIYESANPRKTYHEVRRAVEDAMARA